MTLSRNQLAYFLNEVYSPELYSESDYAPNGLQIEGVEDISRIALAVSATQESIGEAIKWNASALIVHHGLFWKFHGAKTITGPFGARVLGLARNQINLFAYHLPMDGHQDIGHAAYLAHKLEGKNLRPFGLIKNAPTGVSLELAVEKTPFELKDILEKILVHPVMLASHHDQKKIKTLGIITGGANKYWKEAKGLGLDAYLTGEMSEHDWHDARENEIVMFAGGHHATERGGLLFLKEKLLSHFNKPQGPSLIDVRFFDSTNPA